MNNNFFFRPGLRSILALLLILCCSRTACAAGVVPGAQPPLPALSVDIPATANDGEAFVVSISGAASETGSNIRAVTFRFLGRSITAKALPAPPAAGKTAVVTATALLPVPLDHKEGFYTIEWQAVTSDNMTMGNGSSVQVIHAQYPVQQLTLDQKYVTPDPALKERIAKESKQLGTALNSRSNEKHWTLPMARPKPGTISSTFGLRRVLNGQPRSSHKGVDFRGKAGDPIGAIASGTVVLTSDFYYPGRFVVLDHGLGVVSISMHMSEVKVAAGQKVKAGDIIGLVGSTGRSTGPHLHLGLSVLGQSVNALPLLDKGPETWEPKDKP